MVEGLYFDVLHNHLWPQSWGAKPATAEAQQARMRELVENAPKLIPILGHRYLLAEPCEGGNPVLSVYQSDIIIYGVNLYDYFLTEFGDLTGGGSSYGSQLTQEKFEKYQTIPFWGERAFVRKRTSQVTRQIACIKNQRCPSSLELHPKGALQSL